MKFTPEDVAELKAKAFRSRQVCHLLAGEFREKWQVLDNEDFSHLLDMIFEAGKEQGRAILATEL